MAQASVEQHVLRILKTRHEHWQRTGAAAGLEGAPVCCRRQLLLTPLGALAEPCRIMHCALRVSIVSMATSCLRSRGVPGTNRPTRGSKSAGWQN